MQLIGRAMTALSTGFAAGKDSWNKYGINSTDRAMMTLYSDRWAWYTGTIFNEAWKKSPYRTDVRVYQSVSLLLKHVEAVVDFYMSTVYQGSLSTDGTILPDGTEGAIPIDPQVPTTTDEENLRLALGEIFNGWNWKQNMLQRPMFTAALGDCLTELIDDVEAGFVYPSIVWPGYVKEIELDYVQNVKYYAVEWPVFEKTEAGGTEYYIYRREVDGESFRYYKNGRPFDYYGDGWEVENPYGFVPAIWDRYKILWDERSPSATEGTRQALLQVNSLLSQSFDFQRKAFLTPIMVKGLKGRRRQEMVQTSRPPKPVDEDEIDGLAEALGIVPLVGENPTMLQPQFDLGQTMQIIETLMKGIYNENPEARFYPELRQMSQLTGPGVERALGDAVSRCNRMRAGMDIQTVKLFQMAITMMGMRVNNGDWGRPSELSRRQAAFRPYTLSSYDNGQMDFIIKDRPVVPSTERERLELIHMRESIQTEWGLRESGLDDEEVSLFQSSQDQQMAGIQRGVNSGLVIP